MIETIHDYLETKTDGAPGEELLRLVFGDDGRDRDFGRYFLRRLLSADPRFVEDERDGRWRVAPSSLLDRPLAEAPLVVVDLETTGQRSDRSGVTEIGAVRLEGGREVARFESLIDPETPIPPYVARLTGISDAMVSGAPKIEEVFPQFCEFSADSALVAHNAAFDVTLLDQEARRILGRPLGLPSLCTLKLARRMMPELQKASLDALAAHFDLAKAARHRALADAELTVAVLLRMIAMAEAEGVRTLGGLLAAQHDIDFPRRMAIKVRRERFEALPTSSGVFWLENGEGRSLLVGGASDLRSEVLDYFLDPDRLSQRQIEMVAATHDIGFSTCQTALESAVVQARETRKRRPSYNRGDRHLPRGFFVKVSTRRPWPRVFVASKISPDGALYVGPLKGRSFADDAAALLARAFGLRTCPGRLIPDDKETPCWLADAGWCSSPCNGAIESDAYQQRVRGLERALRSGIGAVKETLEQGAGSDARQRAGRDGAVLGRLAKVHRKRHWLVNRHHYLAAVATNDGGLLVLAILAGFCRGMHFCRSREQLDQALASLAPAKGKRRGGRLTVEAADVSTIMAHWYRRSDGAEAVLLELDEEDLGGSLETARTELAPLLPEEVPT